MKSLSLLVIPPPEALTRLVILFADPVVYRAYCYFTWPMSTLRDPACDITLWARNRTRLRQSLSADTLRLLGVHLYTYTDQIRSHSIAMGGKANYEFPNAYSFPVINLHLYRDGRARADNRNSVYWPANADVTGVVLHHTLLWREPPNPTHACTSSNCSTAG